MKTRSLLKKGTDTFFALWKLLIRFRGSSAKKAVCTLFQQARKALLFATPLLLAQTWHPAAPGYSYQFPRDFFSHPDFQTEWWYYTGNLRDPQGHRYGFEITFFRQASGVEHLSAWSTDQIYLAHFALSDIDGHKFSYSDRLNRPGPGLAGADLANRKVWNGNWSVTWTSPETGEQQIRAVNGNQSLVLALNPVKPLVIHGEHGIVRKGPLPGEASHYFSYTRLGAQGSLEIGGRSISVTGVAWMDHEFFTQPQHPRLSGWDWFAIQLDNNTELMLYRLRSKTGTPDPYSSGSYIDSKGNARWLKADEFSLSPRGLWHSLATGHDYPAAWQIQVPSLGLELTEKTELPDQELHFPAAITPSYWEGAVTYQGTQRGQPVQGLGYLEMTLAWPMPQPPGNTQPPAKAHNAK